MTASILTEMLLPAVIALIMFGMGLSLTIADFSRLFRWPKPILIGLIGQMLLMPALALFIALALELSPAMSAGLIILAACPGGTTSNVISQLAKANLALSVTLTGFSAMLCLITSPLLIQFSIEYFLAESAISFSLLTTTLGLITVTLLPIAIGMIVRRTYSDWAVKSDVFFRRFSAAFMAVMIAVILWQERAMLEQSFDEMFLACLLLNLGSIAIGFVLSISTGLNRKDALTLSIEIGVQNATLAILIAMTFLQRPDLAVAAGVYGVSMYIGALLIVGCSRLPHFNDEMQPLPISNSK